MNSEDCVDIFRLLWYNHGMYIRDAYKKRGDKKYSCLVLVETIRTKKGPRQKTILTLGNIDVPREQWA
ncbi:MAG: hypothetical protein AYP45_13295, partial [Candidatus Brocadia carolinensis]